jgi:hypothetical protein
MHRFWGQSDYRDAILSLSRHETKGHSQEDGPNYQEPKLENGDSKAAKLSFIDGTDHNRKNNRVKARQKRDI